MVRIDKILVPGLFAVLGGALVSQTANAAEFSAELGAAMCNTCHGTNGVGSPPIPRIAGQDAEYIFSVMKAFAERQQPSSIMDRHAKGYTEAQLRLLADYFSKQN